MNDEMDGWEKNIWRRGRERQMNEFPQLLDKGLRPLYE